MLVVLSGRGHGFLLYRGPSSLDMINLEKKWILIVHSWFSQNPHQHYLQKCKDRFVCIAPCQVTRRFSRMKMKGTQGLCNCKKKNSPKGRNPTFSHFILSVDPKRKHELPISRIRRAMKSNVQVKVISTHATVLLSKAIEMFILELTVRAWMQADQVKRQTLKRDDFARAIRDGELFNFLSDIVPLQTHKFQVEEANDGQGNELHAAYQTIQPDNIPQLDQFQVGGEANDGQGNECYPAYQNFQPNDILVEGNTDDGQDNEFRPAYRMVQPNNIPCQFQVQKKAKYGQGNKFQARELKLLSEALNKVFDLPAHQMVQPNNSPASFISIPGTPAPSSPEAEFNIDEFLVDNEEDL